MYRKISLRNNLISQVEDIMKETGRYRSIADFVSEAVRLRIEQLTAKSQIKRSQGGTSE